MIAQEAIEAVHAAICEESLADHLDPMWRGRCVKAVEAAAPFLRAQALKDAATDFEDNMGVTEFDEHARRDGKRWAHIDEAWEHQGPYMDWLRARAATENVNS